MRERLLGKLRQNRAFTLMETLVVVALIVVLLGVGVVNVAGWIEDLRMQELDSYAKTIYLEAQNQLSSMEVEGGLPALSKKLSESGSGYETRTLADEPSDYWDNGNISDRWDELYYLVNTDTIITEFVPSFSFVNDGNGKYLIEIEPDTGEIYGVFYWTSDNENAELKGSADEIYEFLKGMTVAEGDKNNRQVNSRMQYEVGYYGGTLSETTVVTDYSLNQKVKVVNDEELYVVVSFDRKGKMLDYQNSNQFDITFAIEDEKANTWAYVMDAKKLEGVVTENGSRIEFALLLDSSISGFDFNTITGGSLVSGEDLTIKVGTTFWHDDLYLVEEPITDSANSYFDEVIDSENVIEVSKVRHLNNLDKYSSTSDITIRQSGNIDFNDIVYAFDTTSGQAVYVGEGNSTTGAPAFAPISNSLIFSVSMGRNVTFNGNGYEIRNLNIVAENSENVGLFASATNVEFANVKIVDPIINASGSTNVGVLAGKLTGCTVDNCGVYLNTYTRGEDGVKNYFSQNAAAGSYANAMEERYNKYTVTGGTNVGGLAGATIDCQISDSFAAVKVNGVENIGGFIGSATNTGGRPSVACITNCYSSGDVKHTSSSATTIGGFIGYAGDLYVTDAYTTSDVYGNNYIGGFLGKAVGSLFGRCNAYGEVLNRSGNDSFGSVKVGGFISVAGTENSNVEYNANGTSTSHYLKQYGYNDEDKLDVFDGALSATYVDLTVDGSGAGAILARTTFAYSDTLTYKAFPFASVTDSHYGDFPLQFTINNSLVYYEKYSEKEYGYYCVTSLNGDTDEDYVWVLNTLQNRTCIEDGYALLSMYYLEEITYTNYQYKSGAWSKVGSKTLNTTTSTYGSNKMVLLSQQGVLQFKAYTPTGDVYTADYSNQSVKSSFTISGMYMYQLPYDLQNTDRYSVENFYDVILFDDGYAKGNDETPVVENQVFYYCPHFAKLAVNPGTGVTSSDGTVDESVITNKSFATLDQPTTVYVRSARQLNALGRVPYYWNDRGGVTKPITYEQEVDINFSTYAGTSKKYCGENFNLLAFDQTYSNQPIGEWNGDSNGYGAFQNDYDGNYHKIIDYCVKSDKQYVGLFGEIYKKSGATESQIRNVVMTVSNPNHVADFTETDPVKQNYAGYIIASFIDTSGASGDNRPRAAVGALVGSDYTIGITDGDAEVFTIYNCASAGYKVQYYINEPTGGQQPLGIAVGGMIGYTRGNVAQSSAANNVLLVAKASITGDTAAVLMGGFTGSCYYGTTLNCYSGGTIDVDDSSGTCCVNRLRIAGFCPGWLDAPGISNTTSSEKVRYQNVYSYTQFSDNLWSVRESSSGGTFDHLIPVVSRMRLVYEKRFDWSSFKNVTKWHTDSTNGSTTGVRVPGFSYYLTSSFTDSMVSKSGAKDYFQKSGSDSPKTCDPATYTQLADMSWVNSNNGVTFISTSQYPTLVNYCKAYPYSSSLAGQSYPFPAFVKDANGNYVHYGDWPTN